MNFKSSKKAFVAFFIAIILVLGSDLVLDALNKEYTGPTWWFNLLTAFFISLGVYVVKNGPGTFLSPLLTEIDNDRKEREAQDDEDRF